MSLLLCYDTETSGLPLYDQPSEDPRQPHIAQLAALLVDSDTRKTIASMNVIVQPAGWEIPAEVTAIHGITTEHAMDVGVSEDLALDMFMEFWFNSSLAGAAPRLRIAHNESFDARIIRIAMKRYRSLDPGMADVWKDAPKACTMQMSTPILKLPSAKKSGYKWPKLAEAYKHFTGKDLVDAHSALADAQACLDVYYAITAAPNQTI